MSLALVLYPANSFGRIFIDINAPSVRKFQIAIPDFNNKSSRGQCPELSKELAKIISDDLDFSGYFSPMDKGAFLVGNDFHRAPGDIRFKDWSVIGAELLLMGNYTCLGRTLEVEIRLYDVFWGRQIIGKRALGKTSTSRRLMHRLGNDIIRTLTGHSGVFLTKLAFVGNESGHKELYVSDFDGHNLRQITNDKSIALMPNWSPNGKRLMYCSYKEGGPMLYVKDMASNTVRRFSGKSGLNIGGSWAPDGSKVALTLSVNGNPDIYTMDLEGKVIRQLTSHWSIDVSPEFSPYTNKIAFVSSRSGSPQIYTVDLVSGRAERLTFEGKYNTSPSWSILNRIAFASMNDGRFDIYTMDADGGRLKRLTQNQGNNEDPCWSPNGRYIIFSSNRDGRYQLYVMDANGQNQRRITTLNGDQTAPCWGP